MEPSPQRPNTTAHEQDAVTSAELTDLNIEYKQLQQREDALRDMLQKVRQEEACLQQAIEICGGGVTTTNPASTTHGRATIATNKNVTTEEERALKRLQEALFAADDDDDESGEGWKID